MKLKSVQFRSGVSVHVGGSWPALSGWNREKHGKDIPCREDEHGDVWITKLDGSKIRLHPWAVDFVIYEAEAVAPSKAVAK